MLYGLRYFVKKEMANFDEPEMAILDGLKMAESGGPENSIDVIC